jgi:peptide/nickel transport system permease protein
MTATATTLPAAGKATEQKQDSQFQVVFRRFLRHRMAVISTVFIAVIFALSIAAPLIAPFPRDAVDISIATRPGAPGVAGDSGQMHPLGVDHLGRDLMTRTLYAARVSLTIAILVELIAETFGVVVGAIAGYYGGWIDAIISRIVDFMLSIPALPILLIVSAIMIKTDTKLPLPWFVVRMMQSVLLSSDREANQIIALVLVLVLFGWIGSARLMRGMVLSLSKQDFVESLRAFGASDARIIFRHLIPNGLAPILVNISLGLGAVIVGEAALSFLSLGVQDPIPSWGNMLNQSQSYMFQHPWLPLIPGIPLILVSLSFNFIGDGLRDALDPRRRV